MRVPLMHFAYIGDLLLKWFDGADAILTCDLTQVCHTLRFATVSLTAHVICYKVWESHRIPILLGPNLSLIP